MDVPRFRRLLTAWHAQARRDLPWRSKGPRDPYAVWVAEVMLQQTRVEVAAPYYERWLKRFPTVAALAEAELEEVLAAWSGLGYYRRARSLHAAARQVMASHGGVLPADRDALRGLPGFGPYTAAAVASIAYGLPAAAVDGNVERVLARVAGTRRSGGSLKRQVTALADDLVPARRAGDWNEALMDLGATVCTPVAPRCGSCPLQGLCQARARGIQHKIPMRSPAHARARALATARTQVVHVAVVQAGAHVLLQKNPEHGLLAGMWMPLHDADPARLATRLQRVGALVREPTRRVIHQFSHRRWDMRVSHVRQATTTAMTGHAGAGVATAWVPLARLADWAVPAAGAKALRAVTRPHRNRVERPASRRQPVEQPA